MRNSNRKLRASGAIGHAKRRGAMLPLVAMCMIVLFGMLALAIDIGMVAIAKSQSQNAADSAATSGARTMNGDSTKSYNVSAVPSNSLSAAAANNILGKAVDTDAAKYTTPDTNLYQSGSVTIKAGSYAYTYNDSDASKEGFSLAWGKDKKDTEPYSAVMATVKTSNNGYAFSRIFGTTTFSTGATAVSVHRPRDVVIVMDLSGSMRFNSLPGIPVNSSGTAVPSSTSSPRTLSMNPETVYPLFGHYSDETAAALKGTTSKSTGSESVEVANISVSTNGGSEIIKDFHKNASGVKQSSSTVAFTRSADSYASSPNGDNYLYTNKNSTTTYGKTLLEIIQSDTTEASRWENGYDFGDGVVRKGYDYYYKKAGLTKTFAGYIEGPGYWGKTFFIWPPDPRGATNTASSSWYNNGAKDWRQRFFLKVRVSDTTNIQPLDHNTLIFDASGAPATASTTTPTPIIRAPHNTSSSISITDTDGTARNYFYRINYEAILSWLLSSPNPFPSQLRAGKIKYYDDIPDPTATKYAGLNTRWWGTTTSNLTDKNERFWRSYIDFVLGVQGTTLNTTYNHLNYRNQNTSPSGGSLSSVPLSAMIGNGDYYAWGTTQERQKPTNVSTAITTKTVSGSKSSGSTTVTLTWGTTTLPVIGQYIRFSNQTGTAYKITNVTSSGSSSTRTATVTISPTLGTSLTTSHTGTTYPNTNTTTLSNGSLTAYMDSSDNPHRPRHQFWFGPMTMIDFLGNYNTTRFWWPGNCHEAQCWACKAGIQTAIDDIKKNHPSDFIGMAYFSDPYSNDPVYDGNGNQTGWTVGTGQWNKAIVPLGRDYDKLKDSLWFPPSTIYGSATEITPYDADFDNVPRAKGGTTPGMGFMIAYNMLSSNISNLRTYSTPQSTYRGSAGGMGRKGAYRLIIFETDGAPNTRANATITGTGKNAYYPIRLLTPDDMSNNKNELPYGGTYSSTEVYTVVEQICKLETDTIGGFSTARRPVLIYPLAYGNLFDPSNKSSQAYKDGLGFLQNVAVKGGTATNSDYSYFPDWQAIYGTNTQRIDRIQSAFSKIMQSGVQVTLIQ